MKLRNKKTGDIWEFDGGFTMKASHETAERAGGAGCSCSCYARSLAELNEEWEDYIPSEPLIKDEKIRKAVRAWAKANDETEIKVKGGCLVTTFKGLHKQLELELNCSWTRDGVYTIAELCGEGEE